MIEIYILTRACDLMTERYATQNAANDACDAWEAGGHEVYTNRLQAQLEYDKARRFNLG